MTLGQIARNEMTFFRTSFSADDIWLSYMNPKQGALHILVDRSPIIIWGAMNDDPGYFYSQDSD